MKNLGLTYRDINFNWFQKQVQKVCREKNVKLYCWSAEGETHTDFERYHKIQEFIPSPTEGSFSFYDMWQNNIVEQHAAEDDRHFNELGHKRMAEHIYYHIIQNQ